MPHQHTEQRRAVTVADSGFGRLGITRAVTLRDTLIPRDIRADERILILGSGEFIHPAAVFARMLQEQSGADVFLQSTTRSPALLWGAMQHKRPAADPYDEGVPYYLYNVPDHSYDRIYLCHEHPANRALADSAACARESRPALQHYAQSLAGLRPDLNIRIIEDFDIPLDDIAAHLAALREQHETLHHNGNNLALLPTWLDKAHTVAHLREHYRRHHGEHLTLGMGDSHIDTAFMRQCDYLITPNDSQITHNL